MTRKTGHMVVNTTLRPTEVDLVDAEVSVMEAARIARRRRPEMYSPLDNRRITRAGFMRAAIRYALEHRAEFEAWLRSDKDAT